MNMESHTLMNKAKLYWFLNQPLHRSQHQSLKQTNLVILFWCQEQMNMENLTQMSMAEQNGFQNQPHKAFLRQLRKQINSVTQS